MTQPSSTPKPQQARGWTLADTFTASRVPLAVVFLFCENAAVRLAVVLAAALTDVLDGRLARLRGASRLGAFLDPVADKLFVGSAFAVVAASRALDAFEIVAVLLRDIAAVLAFLATLATGRPSSIPARAGGKAVTVMQVLTLLAFVTGSPYLRPMAWATGAVGVYAIWDYFRVAGFAARRMDR